jgi:hypothetical protein
LSITLGYRIRPTELDDADWIRRHASGDCTYTYALKMSMADAPAQPRRLLRAGSPRLGLATVLLVPWTSG